MRQSSRTRSSSPGVDRVGLEAVVAADEELLVAQQRDPRVVGVVAARCGLELVAADLEAGLREPLQHPLERPPGLLVGHRVADRGQPGAGRRRRSRPRRARRARRSRRTTRSRCRRRRTRPGGSCTASCPWRSARRGRDGTPSRRRTPAPARRSSATIGAAHRRRRRPACGPPRRPGVVDLEVVVEVERGDGKTGELHRSPSERLHRAASVDLAQTCSSPSSLSTREGEDAAGARQRGDEERVARAGGARRPPGAGRRGVQRISRAARPALAGRGRRRPSRRTGSAVPVVPGPRRDRGAVVEGVEAAAPDAGARRHLGPDGAVCRGGGVPAAARRCALDGCGGRRRSSTTGVRQDVGRRSSKASIATPASLDRSACEKPSPGAAQ